MSFRSEEKRDSLPMLKYIMENGNTTTYQWRTGQKPEVIEEAKVFIDTSEENEVGQVTDDVSYFYLRSVNGSSGNESPKGIKLKCFYRTLNLKVIEFIESDFFFQLLCVLLKYLQFVVSRLTGETQVL